MFLYILQIKKEKSLSPYKCDQEPFPFLPVLPGQKLPLFSCHVPHSPLEQDALLEVAGMPQDSILWWRTIPPQTPAKKCKVGIMRRRGRQKIICLCINPCQDFAHQWLTSHVSAVTLLQSCDSWAGGCGSPSETSSQHQSWAAPRVPCSVPVASSTACLIPHILHMQDSHSCPPVPLKPAGNFWVKRSFIFFPQKYLLTGHRIFQRLQKLDMGGQVHMKRQKGHLPVYYSHKHPTKTLVLHEKKWVPALWVSGLSVGISSLLT